MILRLFFIVAVALWALIGFGHVYTVWDVLITLIGVLIYLWAGQ